MPRKSSVRFLGLFDELPPEAQRKLIEEHLVRLLDLVPKDQAKHVLSEAESLKNAATGMPKLNLKAKKTEMQGLVAELAKDVKRSFIKERSERDELLAEAIDSMTDWLNDIWRVVFEYKTNFQLAHKCLIFLARILQEIADVIGSCKCYFMMIYIDIPFKDKSGHVIKRFELYGAHNLDRVLQWIWREIFVSMLHSGAQRDHDSIPHMLNEISEVLGWRALKLILRGGEKSTYDDDDEDLDGDYDCDEEQSVDEDTEDDRDSDFDGRCLCRLHAEHWPPAINSRRLELRQLILEHYLVMFKSSPSLSLFRSLTSLSRDDSTRTTALGIIEPMATTSSDAFAAALEIYSDEWERTTIANLLNTSYYLLRPRDASALQTAVKTLSGAPTYRRQTFEIIEMEFHDTAKAICSAVLHSFSRINDDSNKQEFGAIIKLRHGTSARNTRIEHWLDSVVTPGVVPANPMIWAAFAMGLPLPPGLEDITDTENQGFLDLDPADPDLEDLREQFRPKLRDRFDGWLDVVEEVEEENLLLPKVYNKIVELMPYFRAGDVIDQMVARISDKPSKHYLCEALETVSSFCKLQRKRHAANNKAKDSKSSTRPPRAPAPAPVPGAPDPSSFAFSFSMNGSPFVQPPGQPPMMGPMSPLSMDDVD